MGNETSKTSGNNGTSAEKKSVLARGMHKINKRVSALAIKTTSLNFAGGGSNKTYDGDKSYLPQAYIEEEEGEMIALYENSVRSTLPAVKESDDNKGGETEEIYGCVPRRLSNNLKTLKKVNSVVVRTRSSLANGRNSQTGLLPMMGKNKDERPSQNLRTLIVRRSSVVNKRNSHARSRASRASVRASTRTSAVSIASERTSLASVGEEEDVESKTFSRAESLPIDLWSQMIVEDKDGGKPKDVQEFLYKVLKRERLFKPYLQHVYIFIDAFVQQDFDCNDIIIQQGDIGSEFFIIESGDVQFSVNGIDVGFASVGESFGELAILFDLPRAATCIAKTPCKLWKISSGSFRYIIEKLSIKDSAKIHSSLMKVPLLQDMGSDVLIDLGNAMEKVTFNDGDVIFNKGDIGDKFYTIFEGQVEVKDAFISTTKVLENKILNEGEYFGERALITGDLRSATIVARGKCTLNCVDREHFQSIFGPFKNLQDTAILRHEVPNVPIYSDEIVALTEQEMRALILVAKMQKFSKDEQFHCGKHIITFMDDCCVQITGQGGGCNVEDLKYGKLDSYTDDGIITFTEECSCILLSFPDLGRAVNGGLSRILQNRQFDFSTLKLHDLRKYKLLGEGSFGKVYLTSIKGKNDPYALKIMHKKSLIEQDQVENVKWEKNIMNRIEHPFVLQLHAAFQDTSNIYMLLRLVRGGEVFERMQKLSRCRLPLEDARFYAACLFEALAYLHLHKIAHRDVKPENVLITKDGYCILVDYGMAKEIEDVSYTACGSPMYMAPEFLKSKGHTITVDCWAFGVTLYEMLVGYTPFDAMDHLELFKLVAKCRYEFPYGLLHCDAEDLIAKLLVKQRKRIGAKAVREHPFFQSIGWDDLMEKNITPPWKPEMDEDFSELIAGEGTPITDASGDEDTCLVDEQDLFKGF